MFVRFYFSSNNNPRHSHILNDVYCIRAHVYNNGSVCVVHDCDAVLLVSLYKFKRLEHLLIHVLNKGYVLFDVRFTKEDI